MRQRKALVSVAGILGILHETARNQENRHVHKFPKESVLNAVNQATGQGTVQLEAHVEVSVAEEEEEASVILAHRCEDQATKEDGAATDPSVDTRAVVGSAPTNPPVARAADISRLGNDTARPRRTSPRRAAAMATVTGMGTSRAGRARTKGVGTRDARVAVRGRNAARGIESASRGIASIRIALRSS